MKKFMNKAKDALDKHGSNQGDAFPAQQQNQQVPMQSGQSSIQAPTLADVTRYRYHHGANLGSIFILEKWLTGSVFHKDSQGSSELAAVEAWVKQEGVDRAREHFEWHWKNYVSDSDLDWLRDSAKCTTVRLPIGYFTLGPPYCEDTPFKKVAPVYQNAWQAVKDLVGRCHQRGIGVLIDMHGLPGGANAQEHSGTNSGKAEFWGSKSYRELATRALCFIAQQTRGMDGVAGIQVINEAEHDPKHMYDWYDDVISQLSKIDPTMPIYISDAWDLGTCASWTQGKNSLKNQCSPVVVDTHLYWCFSDADKQKSPQDIVQEAQHKLSALDGKDGSVIDHGAAQAIVGEYSCVLAENTWTKGGGEGAKGQNVKAFGNAQSQRYQQRSGGSFFWTYRMDWMEGGEWGFKQMTNAQAITPPPSLTLNDVQSRGQHAQGQQAERKQGNVHSHVSWWDSNHPGTYEHWRFEQGWDVGYGDALAFFQMRDQHGHPGGDKIGMLDLWVLKRLRESGQAGQKFAWEFEQGLRQGVKSLYEAVGV